MLRPVRLVERIRGKSAASLARKAGLVLGFGLALATLVAKLGRHGAIQGWFVWSYLGYWLCALGLIVACSSAGFRVMAHLLPRVPLGERLYLSVPAGVLVCFWCTFIAGRLSLLGPVFGILLPIGLVATGAQPLGRAVVRAFGHVRAARRRRAALSGVESVAVALGLLGIAAVYVMILTPENAAYDARWYHLPIAEHYAAAGAIERSPEGWFQSALPHLSSLLYLWPFLFPWLRLFDQVEIAAHFEFVLFLWTLAGVPLLTRWLVPGARVRTGWAAMFLFPALFSYDSCLSIAADHIAALWAIPIYLALRRAWATLEPRACACLGLMLAGATLTKYQALSIVLVAVLAVVLRSAWFFGRALTRTLKRQPAEWGFARGSALAAVTLLAVSSAHWLKNWIWYGDPVYPVNYARLALRPWNLDGPANYRTQTEPELWRPQGNLFEQLKETLGALWSFSFEPHDWFQFHRDWPIFGFLFTLSIFLLPFLRAGRRVWMLFLAGNAAVFLWYFTTHQDRYLQILTPWLVCEVAAVVVLAWRAGVLGRIGIVLLCAAQTIWGAGVLVIPSHSYTGSSLKASFDLLGSGFVTERRSKRFEAFPDWAKAGNSLPQNAKVLVHHEDIHAGLRRQSASDSAMWQGLINYGRLKSSKQVHSLLRSIGVTHVLWIEGDTIARYSVASDLRFSDLIVNGVEDERTFGGIHVARLPKRPPPPTRGERVLYLACSGYSLGVYDLEAMVVIGRNPPPDVPYPKPAAPLADSTPAGLTRLLKEVDFAVVNPDCPEHFRLPEAAKKSFVKRYHRGLDELWVRRRDQ